MKQPSPRRPLLPPALVSVHQLDACLDGRTARRTSWSALVLRALSAPRLRYFNVDGPGGWIIRNAPVFPVPGHPRPQELVLYVDLKARPGARVDRLPLACDLTFDRLERPPACRLEARVTPRAERYWSGIHARRIGPALRAPGPYAAAPFPDILACRADYPNQPCGKNECGPTAVSNSLKWLNDRYGLGIDPGKLSINFWKAVLAWRGDGVANGRWADLKKRFVDDPKNKLPIDSAKESGGHARQVLREFERGQAVEIFIGNHIAAVTCMGVDADGNYHLVASSDAAQNGQTAAGNPVSQPIKISPNGDVLSGPPWARGRVQNFVVQCPNPNKWK